MNGMKIAGCTLLALLVFSYLPASLLGQPKPAAKPSAQEQQDSRAKRGMDKHPGAAKVDPDVYRRLKKRRDGRLYVMVTLNPLPQEAVSDQQRKAAAKKSQDELVAKMPPEEFEVGYRFERDPIVFGFVGIAGLEKLAGDSGVLAVQYKVEPAVHRKSGDHPGEFVYVIVLLRPRPAEQATLDALQKAFDEAKEPEQAKAELEKLERFAERLLTPVLSELTPDDFRFQSVSRDSMPAFWGLASREGIEKLAKNPHVLGVGAMPEERDP